MGHEAAAAAPLGVYKPRRVVLTIPKRLRAYCRIVGGCLARSPASPPARSPRRSPLVDVRSMEGLGLGSLRVLIADATALLRCASWT